MDYITICDEEKAFKMVLRKLGDIFDNICYHSCYCGDCPCCYILLEDGTKISKSDFIAKGRNSPNIERE